MSEIHYFPRYSQKENMTTNNTLLLFRQLYYNSQEKFMNFIRATLQQEDLETMAEFKQQKKAPSGSIPDGLIEQSSFKFVIETKLYGQEQIGQIRNHLFSFENEEQQVLILINKELISNGFEEGVSKVIDEHNEQHGTNIQLATTTFKEICQEFRGVIQPYDLEMQALIDDYEKFCYESKLIDNSDSKIRVVLTGKTLKQNKQYNLYFNPKSRGYQNSKYIGLYKNKAVRAIGEPTTIVDTRYDPEADELEIISVINGHITEEMKERIKAVNLEAKEQYGYPATEERRFFFVDQFYETNYRKQSKGGLPGTRYIDLGEFGDEYDTDMTAEQIAELLEGKEWGI
ncbi:hypothetical protein [Alkalibacillus silvisoli]|uniref:PD-(D/E)XK nuclease family protein n=1 Tax=Alkalibacillus silvisoli TaxID=392823 RepID=A0ABP3K1P1_9BACI